MSRQHVSVIQGTIDKIDDLRKEVADQQKVIVGLYQERLELEKKISIYEDAVLQKDVEYASLKAAYDMDIDIIAAAKDQEIKRLMAMIPSKGEASPNKLASPRIDF